MNFYSNLRFKNESNQTPEQVAFYNTWRSKTPNDQQHAKDLMRVEFLLEQKRRQIEANKVAQATKAAQQKTQANVQAKANVEASSTNSTTKISDEEQPKKEPTIDTEATAEGEEKLSRGIFGLIKDAFMAVISYLSNWFTSAKTEEKPENDVKENVQSEQEISQEESEGLSTTAKVSLAIGLPTVAAVIGAAGYYAMTGKAQAPNPGSDTQAGVEMGNDDKNDPLIDDLEQLQQERSTGL